MQPQEPGNTGDPATLRAALKHVYWLGGGSSAGKSTIARRIAIQHGLHVYSTDDVMPDHAGRMLPEDSPYPSRFKTMDMDERWVNRSLGTMLKTFHLFRGEGFGLIVEDLLRLPRTPAWSPRVSVCCRTWSNRSSPRRLELPIIEVDAAMTEDQLTRWVTQAFGL
jgi:hypothetical protein